ncbi:MAG: hypothetical protein LUQ71_00515, partial [Methanoregula sp.]|nr:hypothetical protein [Methanoregula sp.]
GGFDANDLSGEEQAGITEKKSWFFTGEALMASLMAATIAIPAGIWFAGRTELSLAFIGAGILFLPLFVFLPRLIRYAMKADTDAVLDAFGKNEQIRKVFWTLFLGVTGLVLAEIADPAAAEQIVETLTGI